MHTEIWLAFKPITKDGTVGWLVSTASQLCVDNTEFSQQINFLVMVCRNGMQSANKIAQKTSGNKKSLNSRILLLGNSRRDAIKVFRHKEWH